MDARLSIEITDDSPDGETRGVVDIQASNEILRLACVALSKAVADKLNITVSALALALVMSEPYMDEGITTEAVIDVSAIRRAQQRGGGDDAADG